MRLRPGQDAGGGTHRRTAVAVLVLTLLTGCGGGGDATPRPTRPADLAALDAAIAQVSATRKAVLTGLDAVMAAATAVDQVDAACAKGDGPAARTAARAAAPLVGKAKEALTTLPSRVSSYQRALAALDREDVAVTGPPAQVLVGVETGGRAEATAAARFRTSAARVWPAYERLRALADTWTVRALTPWYRDRQEGANAYAVLVGPSRSELEQARTQLAAASEQVHVPSAAQSRTLATADRVLAEVGSTPGP